MSTTIPDVPAPAGMSAAEWRARQQLAGCYRVFDLLGWTELIYNHISLRVPGTDQAPEFLINPFGLHYSEVTASNLLKVDLAGRLLGESPWRVNPAGFHPHATVHAGVPGAHCVMHTHTTAGMAVAKTAGGIAIDNFYAAQLGGRIAYHAFEGITVHADEGPRLLATIVGDGRTPPKPAVVLRNHGLLAWGRTLPECFYTLWLMQRTCEIQVAGAALGPALDIPPAIQRRCQDDAMHHYAQPLAPDGSGGLGQDAFDAILRRVDRHDTGWRA